MGPETTPRGWSRFWPAPA